MLSEDTIKELVSTPAFISHCNKLAYELHMSHKDASQLLLLELLDHRLKSWTDKDVTLAIHRDLPSLKWRIKYSRKDIVRKEAKDANRELAKASMVAHMTRPQASNPDEVLEALARIPELFKNANTRTWAESVLRVGKKETMVRFGLTSRQFGNKLAKTCDYARQHQQPNTRTKDKKAVAEFDLLKEYIILVDNDASDEQVGQWIYEHKESPSLNEVVDSPLIKFQGKVLKDFVNSGVDRYTFNELMHTRLEQELHRRDINE